MTVNTEYQMEEMKLINYDEGFEFAKAEYFDADPSENWVRLYPKYEGFSQREIDQLDEAWWNGYNTFRRTIPLYELQSDR